MIISKKKPMVYGAKTDGVLYYEVFDDGYGIMVKNIRGSHPCGYVRLPDEIAVKIMEDNSSKYCEDSIWIDADIHGGITYSGFMDDFAGYFIGWDYAHYGDYTWTGYDHLFREPDEKHWTTDEVIEEAKLVVKALRDGKYKVEGA